MDRRDLNRNQNYRRNDRRNDDSLKEEMQEQTEEFKETFVKAKETESSHTVLKDVHDKTKKSLIIYDSSYQN